MAGWWSGRPEPDRRTTRARPESSKSGRAAGGWNRSGNALGREPRGSAADRLQRSPAPPEESSLQLSCSKTLPAASVPPIESMRCLERACSKRRRTASSRAVRSPALRRPLRVYRLQQDDALPDRQGQRIFIGHEPLLGPVLDHRDLRPVKTVSTRRPGPSECGRHEGRYRVIQDAQALELLQPARGLGLRIVRAARTRCTRRPRARTSQCLDYNRVPVASEAPDLALRRES